MYDKIFFLVAVIFICSFPTYHFYNEYKTLKRKLDILQNINQNYYYPHIPDNDTYIKRIGAIFLNGDMNTQDYDIKFVVDDNYHDIIYKEWSDINILKQNEINQSKNEPN